MVIIIMASDRKKSIIYLFSLGFGHFCIGSDKQTFQVLDCGNFLIFNSQAPR